MLRKLRSYSHGMTALCLAVLGQVLLGQGLLDAGRLRADDVAAEQRLPPGVLGFFSVPDVVDMKDRLMESSFGQMLQDDSLTEFKAQFQDKWDDASKDLEEKLGVSMSDLLGLADGEVTLAVLQPPGQPIGVVALLDFGDNRATLDTLIEKAREKLEELGAARTVETVNDTEVTVFTNESVEDGPNAGGVLHPRRASGGQFLLRRRPAGRHSRPLGW